MDKFIKLNATNSAPYNSTNNLVDFVIPEGIYDFSSSYINLTHRLKNITMTAGTGNDKAPSTVGIVNLNPEWDSSAGADTYYENCSLVKNCNMRASKSGTIEDIRRVDVLMTNLKKYTNNIDVYTDNNYKTLSQVPEPLFNAIWGLSSELNKEGSKMSEQKTDYDVKIPLKDLFGIGNAREVDVNKTGKISINLELRADKITSFSQFPKLVTDMGSANVYIPDNIPVSSTNVQSLTISGVKFKDLAQSPYYVGMPVLISATNSTGSPPAIVGDRNVITQIDFNKDGTGSGSIGNITLTFAGIIGSTTGSQTYEDIRITPQLVDSVSSEFSDAEIVLCTVGNPSGNDEIGYFTYSTEEGNGLGATSFHKQFQLEPECLTSVLMFPEGTDDLNSTNTDITSYRTRDNTEDNSDRDITIGKPLENKMIGEGLSNMGLRHRSYRNQGLATNQVAYQNTKDDGKKIISIFDSHRPTGREQLYQVNINAGGSGVNKYILYKQLPKVLSY